MIRAALKFAAADAAAEDRGPPPAANDDEEPDGCRPCGGTGVDQHGFDCLTCFGTGEADE